MKQSFVGITSITYDAEGDILIPYFPGKSNFGLSERRVSRTLTLDGGVVISDQGWTALDREISLVMRYTADAWARLQHLHQDKTSVHIALSDGYFEGTIKNLKATEGQINLTLWLSEKLSD